MRHHLKAIRLPFDLRSTSARNIAIIGCCALLVAAFFYKQQIAGISVQFYERIMWALDPSAERAWKYGERHFDGHTVFLYDVDEAEYFLREAQKRDPLLPYVHHELARIAFLRGDFGTAIGYINAQIALHGDTTPNSYYVRGLIEGYMGDYTSAAKDYEYFLKFSPHNWAGINDYAWVLLKDGRAKEAAEATEDALQYFPDNPWLLNSSAIALFEIGEIEKARERAQNAWTEVQKVQDQDWLKSYPGNDPAIADEGIKTFRAAVLENMHRIELAIASSTVQ